MREFQLIPWLELIHLLHHRLVIQILDHNKKEYRPTSVSRHVNCVYVIASLKRNVGCNKLLRQSSEVCREGTIFNLFFPYSLFPLPNVDCKTVTLFLRIQVGRGSSQKKKRSDLEPDWRWRARLRRKAKTMLNRFWEKPTRLVCILCPMLYKTKVFVRVIILLYPKPSQLLLSGLLQVTKKVKMSKRTSRTKEFGIIMRIWSFGLDFVFYTTTWEISAIWLA